MDVAPHAALMPCVAPSVRRPRTLFPSSPRPSNASIDLSFYRIYRIEGGKDGRTQPEEPEKREEKCAPPAFLFTRSANDEEPRLRGKRADARPRFKLSRARRPARCPVPFPFFFLFLHCPQ